MKRKTKQRLGFQNFKVPGINKVLGFRRESWRRGEKSETFFFFFGKVEGFSGFLGIQMWRLSWTNGQGILGMKAHLGVECMELPIFFTSTQIS